MKSSVHQGSNSGISQIKPGPLKAFTSPEPPKGVKGVSPTIRTKSVVMDKVRSSPMGDHSDFNEHQSDERMKSGSAHVVKQRTFVGSATGSKYNKHVSDSSHSSSNSKIGESCLKTSSSRDPTNAGPQLEAVLTLSKGKSGDATDVHQFMPSPPPSNKPTTPRPSSAQRFRSMVFECRDSS